MMLIIAKINLRETSGFVVVLGQRLSVYCET